jgi:hypothetical protein
MTDTNIQDTVTALKALKDQHTKRLADNPDFKAIQALDQAIAKLTGVPSGQTGRSFDRQFTRDSAGNGQARLSQPAAARQVILNQGKPVRTQELLEEIQRMGVHVGGKNPRGNLVSILSGRDQFKSVPWGGRKAWWVADQPLPKESNH